MSRNIVRIFALVALVAAAPQPVRAQTAPVPPGADASDAFFDGSVLHDVFLTINSRDWSSLKEHFLDNTYYPCDFKWNGQTVRNIGIRSRGTGSRSSVKPGLRIDFDSLHHGPDVRRPEVGHPTATTPRIRAACASASAWRCSSAWAWPPNAKRTRASTSTTPTSASSPSSNRWTRRSWQRPSTRAMATSTNTPSTMPRRRRSTSAIPEPIRRCTRRCRSNRKRWSWIRRAG